jgi:molybdopterin/thiamine biosynthesis adenylyltransferase
MRNWIWDRPHVDDNRQLITSKSDIIRMIENAKDLVTKEKINEFKPQRQTDQLSTTLKTEEHRGRT